MIDLITGEEPSLDEVTAKVTDPSIVRLLEPDRRVILFKALRANCGVQGAPGACVTTITFSAMGLQAILVVTVVP